MNKDEETLAGATQAFLDSLGPAECITPEAKEKVLNEAEALFSFASSRDKEGVRQAYDLLRSDIGFPELAETPAVQARTQGKSGFARYRTVPLKNLPSGYRLTVDGKEEIKFVPQAVAAETFQAQVRAHPTRRVELVPVIEAPRPRPVVGPAIEGRRPIIEEVKHEAPSGEGYMERTRDASGKVTQIKYFDSKGDLIQTIEKGNFETLE